MKKCLSFILCLVMSLALIVPAYATETITGDNIAGAGIIVDVEEMPSATIGEAEEESNEADFVSGEGELYAKVTVEEGFYEDILLILYNKTTGDKVEIPIYGSNNYTTRSKVPVGKYLVYNVLAGGDDPMDPEYRFDVSQTLTEVHIQNGEFYELMITQLGIPGADVTEPTEPVIDPNQGVTDTEMKGDDLNEMDRVEDVEERPVLDALKALANTMFGGANTILLLILGGSLVAYLVIKKKKEDKNK